MPNSRNGIVLVEFAFDFDVFIAPGVAIFAHQPVAAHNKALQEAILVDGVKHVIGGGGAEVAAGPIYRREHILMEVDDRFRTAYLERAGRDFFFLRGRDAEFCVFAPGGKIAGTGIEGKG